MKNPYNNKNPYVSYGKVAQKIRPQNAGVGYDPSVEGDLYSLEKRILSLEERLKYKYEKGVPAAYVGGKEYEPEESTFTLDIEGDGTLIEPVNYVMRSGVDRDIRVTLQGPGVFLAKAMVVSFLQKDITNINSVQWYKIPLGKKAYDARGVCHQTRKYSIQAPSPFLSSGVTLQGVNFFWNLIDAESGRMLCEDMLPDQALCPQVGEFGIPNGFMYLFETPWLFERANTIVFRYRLLNDILQFATTSLTAPATGGQNVRVQIELHGTKFYNERDTLLREGAR